MKYYRIAPTRKKSVVEFTQCRKEDKVNNGFIWATKELGWRSGVFFINVPETDEEIEAWIEGREDLTREDIDEMIKGGHNPFLPTKDMDFVELNDYDYNMDHTWDGCWEDWTVTALRMNDEELEEFTEELTEGYYEDGYSYLEENDWIETDCWFEIHCEVEIEEVDDPYTVDTQEVPSVDV